MYCIVSSQLILSADPDSSSPHTLLRLISTFPTSYLSMLRKQVLRLPRLALGMLLTFRSTAICAGGSLGNHKQ